MDYIILDSFSQLLPGHKGMIVVCGSHGGISAAKHALSFAPGAVFCSDGGKGKDDAGIQGLILFDEHGIPAGGVDTWSARIGDGKDIHGSGILSSVNQAAKKYGISEGMTVKDAIKTIVCDKKEK